MATPEPMDIDWEDNDGTPPATGTPKAPVDPEEMPFSYYYTEPLRTPVDNKEDCVFWECCKCHDQLLIGRRENDTLDTCPKGRCCKGKRVWKQKRWVYNDEGKKEKVKGTGHARCNSCVVQGPTDTSYYMFAMSASLYEKVWEKYDKIQNAKAQAASASAASASTSS